MAPYDFEIGERVTIYTSGHDFVGTVKSNTDRVVELEKLGRVTEVGNHELKQEINSVIIELDKIVAVQRMIQ